MAQNKIQKIQLSEEQQTKLAEQLDQMIEEAEDFHSAWDDLHDIYLNQYLCKPDVEQKLTPWPGASNLFIPLGRIVQDGVMAQLHDAMFTNDPYMKVAGVEGSDLADAESLSLFYGEHVYKRIINLPVLGNQWNFLACLDGTAVIKKRRDRSYQLRREIAPLIEPRYRTDSIEIDGVAEQQETLDGYEESFEERVIAERRNQPSIQITDMTRLFISPETAPAHDGMSGLQWPNCPWYFEDLDLTVDELKSRKHTAGYQNVDETLLAQAEKRSLSPQERTRRSQEDLDESIVAETVNVKEFYMRMVLPGSVRMPDGVLKQQTADSEDGLAEEVVLTYFPDTRKIARIVPIWRITGDGRRPHLPNWYNQLPLSFYGQGVQAKMRHLNAMQNSGMNQMVDCGHIANQPWFIYQPSSAGLFPEITGLVPGQGVPVQDPRSVVFPRFNNDQSFWLNLIQQIQIIAERDGLVNDNTQGRRGEKSETARGRIALLQQSAIAFGRLASLMVLSYEEMFRTIHADYRRFGNDEILYKVTNNNKTSYRRMTREVLGQDVDFQFVLNPNRQQLVQTFQILFQLMIGIPYIQQNPPAVRALAKQLYDATGTKNFSEVWPEEMTQQIMMQQQQAAAAQQQAAMGGQPGMGPGGPPQPPQGPMAAPPMPNPMAMMMGGQNPMQMDQMGGLPPIPAPELDDSELAVKIQ